MSTCFGDMKSGAHLSYDLLQLNWCEKEDLCLCSSICCELLVQFPFTTQRRRSIMMDFISDQLTGSELFYTTWN